MDKLQPGTTPESFIWATGIEDTFVPQTRKGHRALDEYELTGHYHHWREDLALAGQLGVQAIRWGVPWYRVEPEAGKFDWRWTDQVIPYIVETLGITPIIDLMHYGCPFWLEGSFLDERYPRAVAAYAAAFARRYRELVHWYTPLNEPTVNALMCGRRGLWPPYRRGDRGYVAVLLQLMKGINRTVDAVRTVDPQALMVHVEAVGLHRCADAGLQMLAEEQRWQRFLSCDLLTGRVESAHPLFGWLMRNGASIFDLHEMRRGPATIDLMGLNFYPQWSTRQLFLDREGRLASRICEKDGRGFGEIIAQYHERYGLPSIITETSAFGSQTVRAKWLDDSLAAIKRLRGQGIPVLGYTWFPLFTMVDWRYRFGRRPLDHYYLDLGLFTFDRQSASSRWRPTTLAQRYQQYIRQPDRAIGSLSGASQVA